MAVNIASTDPPMTLAQRQELRQLCVQFCVPPHEILFTPSLGDVMTRQKLCDFVDDLLVKLAQQFPTTLSPKPGAWKLVKDNASLDLEAWNPRSLNLDTAIIVASNVEEFCPVVAEMAATNNQPWTWGTTIKSVRFPSQGTYVLESDNRVLIVLRCQTKYRITSKRKGIKETSHTVFIPLEYTVQDVLSLVQTSYVTGVYVEPHENNLRGSVSTARALGWGHGTTLRLELW